MSQVLLLKQQWANGARVAYERQLGFCPVSGSGAESWAPAFSFFFSLMACTSQNGCLGVSLRCQADETGIPSPAWKVRQRQMSRTPVAGESRLSPQLLQPGPEDRLAGHRQRTCSVFSFLGANTLWTPGRRRRYLLLGSNAQSLGTGHV